MLLFFENWFGKHKGPLEDVLDAIRDDQQLERTERKRVLAQEQKNSRPGDFGSAYTSVHLASKVTWSRRVRQANPLSAKFK